MQAWQPIAGKAAGKGRKESEAQEAEEEVDGETELAG
jgi:hypothetical protein